jgi:hypothetical protein
LISPHATELLEHQREMFREKFGRDPGRGDPFSSTPTRMIRDPCRPSTPTPWKLSP